MKQPRCRVKICCIRSVHEARLAIECGASALGLVSCMPSGPGTIDEDLIREIARTIPPPVASFLLTSERDPARIVDQQRRCGTNTLQLCDHLSVAVLRELREALPGIGLVQVVHVEDESSLDYAREMSSVADALLLDSGRIKQPVKQLGGTGRTHDWGISRRIRESVSVPVFLAGGIKAVNVNEAISRVEPFGIDLCTGVRVDGALDETLLRAFFAQLT